MSDIHIIVYRHPLCYSNLPSVKNGDNYYLAYILLVKNWQSNTYYQALQEQVCPMILECGARKTCYSSSLPVT